jgi:hypothetical protein
MHLDDLSTPSMAIIIGCWQDHAQPIHKRLFQDILEFTNNCPQIEVVAVSTQHCSVQNSLWAQTADAIFFDEQPVDWIRRCYTNLSTKRFTNLNLFMDNNEWNNKVKISIVEQWQLEYLLNHVYTHVKNVYYFGVGWNVGVQRDYIGWGHLSQSIQHGHVRPINLLTHEKLSLVNTNTSNDHLHYTQCNFEYPDFSNNLWAQLANTSLRYKQDYTWNYDKKEYVRTA